MKILNIVIERREDPVSFTGVLIIINTDSLVGATPL